MDNTRYCNVCGAKVIKNRLTLKNLFESFSEQFLNWDNKFLQTFLALFKKPEDVIGSYIEGTRKKYVNVVSYFAIAITLSGLQIYIMQQYPMDYDAYLNPDPNIAKMQKEFNDSMFKFVSDYQSLIMMLYIPFYALLVKLFFIKNRTYNYTERLVIFMYAQAQISIAIGIFTIILIPLGTSMTVFGLLVVPIQIFYFAYCLKRVYNLTTAEIILKTLLFLIVLGIILVIIIILGSYLMYEFGMLDEVIESKKQAIEAKKASGN